MNALSIVSHCHTFVVGVDTHARNLVYAILNATNGALLDTQSFPTTAAGINRAIRWVARRTDADAETLWVIEGATVTSDMHNQVMAPVWEAETALVAAEKIHQGIPAKLRLGDLNSGQQVLDTEVKMIHTGIRMGTYNTAMTIAREIRTNTGYRRANQEAHALMRQAFNQAGDIDTTKPGYLTITLDPLPTQAKTAAAAQLCEHLIATKTRYPGTNLILKYAIKNRACS